jgi:hypothetical protein
LVLGTAANGSGALHNGVAGAEWSLSNLTPVAGGARDPRPVLAVDVDGVISLFGFDEPLTEAPGEVHLIDGMAHCISSEAGERLARLADHYELVWATGWEERANDYLPELLGLPDELPYLTFGGNARFGTAHWKVDAIAKYAGDRPVAWVDDCRARRRPSSSRSTRGAGSRRPTSRL